MAPAARPEEVMVLPKDLLEMQLGQVDLLLAMYASDDAIYMNESSSALVDDLRSWCEAGEGTPPSVPDTHVHMHLTLDVTDGKESLELDISLPVAIANNGQEINEPTSDDPPKAKIRIRQPPWMSKSDATRFNNDIPDEDLLTVLEHIKEAASLHITNQQKQQSGTASSATDAHTDTPTVRAWFYFPSISTRSKRDDLINHAPAYGLTGFLLAGKPGVLCLEGGAQAIDDFMRFIKTDSWGDIPPQHKKVSERYREVAEVGPGVARAFEGMREITDLIGERRGERANRNDMKALESWLVENGVGDAFAKVLI